MPVVYPNVPSHLYEEHPPPKKKQNKNKKPSNYNNLHLRNICRGILEMGRDKKSIQKRK